MPIRCRRKDAVPRQNTPITPFTSVRHLRRKPLPPSVSDSRRQSAGKPSLFPTQRSKDSPAFTTDCLDCLNRIADSKTPATRTDPRSTWHPTRRSSQFFCH